MQTNPYAFLSDEWPFDPVETDVVFVPVAYDASCTFKKGTAFAPEAIIMASRHIETFSPRHEYDLAKLGLHTAHELVPEVNPDVMVDELAEIYQKYWTDGALVVTLGGEHSISIGVMKAFLKSSHPVVKEERPLIVHFDAHADMLHTYNGSKNAHACVAARWIDMGYDVYQYGIRSNAEEESKEHIRQGINKFDLQHRYVYISIDVDVLDAMLVSTGTPEPFGWTWEHLMSQIEKVVFASKGIVGFDVMELIPDGRSEVCAAVLIRDTIAAIRRYRKSCIPNRQRALKEKEYGE